MLTRRVLLLVLTTVLSFTTWGQTNTAAGAGTYPAQPQPNSTTNLGVRPEVLPWDTGEAGLHLLAKKLKNTGRIMHLTAHPDDEDGALLTYLARGQGRQVLLMSLTRGEGGQNRTGSNLWDELGVLRTLELLESTRYYGTELRFSRVADFGFSKSADETFQKWGGHQVPLRDIVYVIREWKPDVLFTRFSGTPRDGHGHHQASAILAPEAVKCAADPNCFPDQLKGDHALTTWQVLKLYMGNQGGEYTVRYDVSQIDPDTKLSYTQMALEGFKHQASQLSGNFTPPSGPNWRLYKLISTAIPNYKADKEQDFFDGIDTSVDGLSRRVAEPNVSWLRGTLTTFSALAPKITPGKGESLGAAVRPLFGAYSRLDTTQLSDGSRAFLKGRIAALVFPILRRADELFKTPTTVVAATTRPVTPGEPLTVQVQSENNSGGLVQVRGYAASWIDPLKPQFKGQSQFLYLDEGKLFNSQHRAHALNIQVPKAGMMSRPHWYRKNPEKDAVYQVTNERIATLPISGELLTGFIALEIKGEPFQYSKIATQVGTAKFVPVRIVPELSLLFAAQSRVVPTHGAEFSTDLIVRNTTSKANRAVVELSAPSGWSVTPKQQTVTFNAPGQEQRITFKIVVPAEQTTNQQLSARVSASGAVYAEGFTAVTRPDLDTFYYFQPAVQRVSIVDVNVPKNLRVGYIPGAGDDIFPVLQQLGLNAKQISNDELAKGDLHQYDTIVVGIRGYDERPEIRANNQRLLDFVNDGGTLLVQNQKAEDVFNSGHFTPYPATLGRERVSVEEAPVTILAPNDSVFNVPNKITQADFDGWVQERGINFMSNWDPKFEPLLACNDPGEQSLKGGLLRAKYGKGTYIYTGYAFFRQLPAGVPGAVRLYVNLLNAGHEAK